VWQWWEVPTVLEWRIEGALGDRQSEWVAEKATIVVVVEVFGTQFSIFHGL